MRVEVKVPQLPESVAEATLVSWHKKVGEAVARDENLVDVETDKVVLELPAPQSGVLVEIRQADGATVAGQRSSLSSTPMLPPLRRLPQRHRPAVVASPARAVAHRRGCTGRAPRARKMMADLAVIRPTSTHRPRRPDHEATIAATKTARRTDRAASIGCTAGRCAVGDARQPARSAGERALQSCVAPSGAARADVPAAPTRGERPCSRNRPPRS
jgi:2-oxoglutarate dehydrogenase E2 component (dihydrolipoamide succinyltransferase)